MDTKEPEAADSLHRSPISGDGGVSLSLLLPGTKMSGFLTSSLYAISSSSVIWPMTVVSSANFTMVLELCVAVGEQGVEERAEHAALRGTGVEDQGGGCDVSHPHCLGSARQEVQDPVTEGAVEPRSLSLMTSLEGTMVLKAEL